MFAKCFHSSLQPSIPWGRHPLFFEWEKKFINCTGFAYIWLELELIFEPWFSSSVGFPGGSAGKESACFAGNPGSIPGSGRSLGEGNGNPLQNSCLKNSMDRGAWGGYSPWGHKESDVTEWLTVTLCLQCIPFLWLWWSTSLTRASLRVVFHLGFINGGTCFCVHLG